MYQEGRVLFCCKCSHLLCWDWVPLCAFVRWHCWECGHHFLWLGPYLRFLWLTSSMGRKTFQLTASARRKRVIYKSFKSLIEITSTASCRQITRALQGRKWQGDRGRPSFKTVGALALLQEMVHPAFFFWGLFMRCQWRGHGQKPSPMILYEMTFTWNKNCNLFSTWIESVTHSHIPVFTQSIHRIPTELF